MLAPPCASLCAFAYCPDQFLPLAHFTAFASSVLNAGVVVHALVVAEGEADDPGAFVFRRPHDRVRLSGIRCEGEDSASTSIGAVPGGILSGSAFM
jgi:hypothetical protein